ncbi:MAG: VacJ family lipoprotein [Rhodobacteraceae bacterium]|nr:VacJ family lipoprotein [Paracoccaceae bacterium]
MRRSDAQTRARALVTGAVLLVLAACGPAPVARGINDPNEAANREVHAFNKALDRTFLRGGAEGVKSIPQPLRTAVRNLGGNLDMPRIVLNDLLQGNADDAVHNGFRFLVNTTFGLGGLLDPATDMGLDMRATDFGETLHVWGAPEGAYVELPVLGPSTERDTAGLIVDLALNPLRFVLPARELRAATALRFAARLSERAEFGATVDSLLYQSADSYAQVRLLYLQNRRFRLGGGDAAAAGAVDPYGDPDADPYDDPAAAAGGAGPPLPADPALDPFYDPYEDPNVR